MEIRSRIRELRHVRAGDLLPHPDNWRVHPDKQRRSLNAMLERIGYADALIARETPDGLMLIDGHLRAELTPDAEVPVLVTDLSEPEALELLATLDPLAAMAEEDEGKLAALLEKLESDVDSGIMDAIERIDTIPLAPSDPAAEWQDMPEFHQPDATSFRRITVHFLDQAAVDSFVQRLNLEIAEKTRSIYYPETPPEDRKAHLRYKALEQ